MTDAAVMEADVIVVGAGLAGLVATAELIADGKSVIVVEQESDIALHCRHRKKNKPH